MHFSELKNTIFFKILPSLRSGFHIYLSKFVNGERGRKGITKMLKRRHHPEALLGANGAPKGGAKGRKLKVFLHLHRIQYPNH